MKSPTERLRKPGKRLLSSFWGHFYKAEQNCESLLEAHIIFQKKFRWDFIKINPSSVFFIEDWGNCYRKFDTRKQEIMECRIKNADDFLSLEKLDPHRGVRGAHLGIIKGLNEAFPKTPLFMTLFNPLSYAGRLCGGHEKLKIMLREFPAKVKKGLEIIAGSIREFSQASIEYGCHGFFYATTEWGSREIFSKEEYEKFSMGHDLAILESIKGGERFTILHVCKGSNRLKDLLHYPVDGLSWDWTDRSNPSFQEIASLSDRILIGGVSQGLLENVNNWEAVRLEIDQFIADSPSHPVILAPGCAFNCIYVDLLGKVREYLDERSRK